MTTPININFPPSILNLIQTGLLERAYHDALMPTLLFRQEATRENWEGNVGTEQFQTRAGLIPPNTNPLTPGTDPTPKQVPYEQWVARAERFGDTVDIHMPTAAVANGDLFARTIQQLGINAGMSVNRLARDAMFKAYLSGSTVLTAATLTTDTIINVAAVNGFTDVLSTRPTPVSPTSPLAITIGTGSAAVTRNVIGYTLNDPTDPYGPGTLTLSAAIGTAFVTRSAVLSSARPKIIRSGGGDSIDAIGPSDTLVLQDVINAVGALRDNNVMPHPDGTYHAHISNAGNSQMFADQVWQRLHTAMPDSERYQQGFVGQIAGVSFYLNNESPTATNTGTRVQSGSDAFAKYSPSIGAETTNSSGVNIGRVLLTGRGGVYEKWFDESRFVSEAGVVGKIGQFDIMNNGLRILTEGIRLYLRAPMDRMGDLVAATWSITTCFPVPSDALGFSGPERFKRMLIIEHAI